MALSRSAIAGLIVTSVICALTFSGGLPSASTDIAFHYSLADIISRYGGRYPPALEMYMDAYPALAHWMAGIVGRISGSVIVGVLSVGAVAVGAAYFAIVYIAARTSMVAAGLLVCAFVVGLSLQVDGSAIYGFELVTNYFFGQVVGLALCWLSLLIIAPFVEEGPTARVTFLTAVLVFVVTAAHLVPGLELAAAIGVLVLYRTLQTRRWLQFVGFCAVVSGMLLVHPSLRVMLTVSTNDGSVALGQSILRAAPFVAMVDIVLASLILRIRFARGFRSFDGAEVLAAMAVSTAGLCLLQAIALQLGQGSGYAVGKYAHGVYTLLVVQIAILFGMLFRAGPASPSVASTFASVAAILITALILPRPLISTAVFNELAEFARHNVTLLGHDAAKQTVVLARSVHATANFMITAVDIGNKKATRDYALLAGHLPESSTFRYAVVDAGDPLFPDTCDMNIPASRYRIVDMPCALSTVTRLRPGQPMLFRAREQGGYALRKGWSLVEGDGVWSTGSLSTIVLTLPPTKDASLTIDAAALLDPRRSSLRVSYVVAGHSVDQVYDLQHWRATTMVPLSDSDVDREVTFEVKTIDAPDGLPYAIRLFGISLKPGTG